MISIVWVYQVHIHDCDVLVNKVVMKKFEQDYSLVKLVTISLFLVTLISGTTLMGWLFDYLVFASVRRTFIPMAPSTAIVFIVLCGGLYIYLRSCQQMVRWIPRISAVCIVLVSTLILIDYCSDTLNWNIEGLIPLTLRKFDAVTTGRMSPITAGSFSLAGLSLLLLSVSPGKTRHMHAASALLAAAVTAVGMVTFLGYMYGSPLLYGGTIIPVALPTAVALIALGSGLCMANGPDFFPQRLFLGSSIRSRLMRAFLPVTVAIVLFHGLLDARFFSRFSNPSLGLSLMTLFSLVVVGTLITFISKTIGSEIDGETLLRRQAEEELRKANDNLELRVRKRTEGLAATLDNLSREMAERKLAEEALHVSEERFRSLFEQSLDAVFLTVPNGNIVAANPTACRIFGMTEQELCRLGRAGIIDANDVRLATALEERQRTGLINIELTCIRKSGERFPVEVSSVIVPGEPPRSFVIMRDITERKQAEEKLQQAHDELELRVAERTEELALSIKRLQDEIMERKRTENSLREETAKRLRAVEALREKEQMLIHQSRQAVMGEMIDNIAHQWRQPLNTLGLTIQQLSLLYDSGQFSREFLNQIVSRSMKQIHYMSRTIEDFRNFFSPDKQKIEFKVRESIDNILSLLDGSLRTSSIGVEIAAKDELVIHGYQNEFAQVLLNILVNAKDALIEKEVSDPRVAITLSHEDGCAVVTIADNAGGIPEEILGKIFDPHFTTKGPQRGTGVGLFMSKAIIEKNMGGRLSVCNVADGAEFRIEVCDESRN